MHYSHDKIYNFILVSILGYVKLPWWGSQQLSIPNLLDVNKYFAMQFNYIFQGVCLFGMMCSCTRSWISSLFHSDVAPFPTIALLLPSPPPCTTSHWCTCISYVYKHRSQYSTKGLFFHRSAIQFLLFNVFNWDTIPIYSKFQVSISKCIQWILLTNKPTNHVVCFKNV